MRRVDFLRRARQLVRDRHVSCSLYGKWLRGFPLATRNRARDLVKCNGLAPQQQRYVSCSRSRMWVNSDCIEGGRRKPGLYYSLHPLQSSQSFAKLSRRNFARDPSLFTCKGIPTPSAIVMLRVVLPYLVIVIEIQDTDIGYDSNLDPMLYANLHCCTE